MLKKTLLGLLFAASLALLVIGGIHRTAERTAMAATTGDGDHEGETAGHEHEADASTHGQAGSETGGEETATAAIVKEPASLPAPAISVQAATSVESLSQPDGTAAVTAPEAVMPGRGNGTGSGGLGQPETQGAGQADVDDWLVLVGEVTAVTPEALTVTAPDGASILVAGRAWLTLQEQGFAADIGHALSVTGFYDQDRFEIGTVTNLTTGVASQVRDASGRPMWAGRGGGARDS